MVWLPKDRALNKVVREQVEGTAPNERVLFIDTDNQVREAVYPSEFETGVLDQVRGRLERDGVLKAVVHISARVLGSPAGHGPRTTVLEYLPDGKFYGLVWQPPLMSKASDDAFASALEKTKHLFGNGERKERKEDP